MGEQRSFSVRDILTSSRQSLAQTKEAQVNEKLAGDNDDELGAILDSITGESKEASAPAELQADEVSQLLQQKIAELAGVSQSAMIKEAQLVGAAIHDGFLLRGAETEHHATKVAQVLNVSDPDLSEIADGIGFDEGVKIASDIANYEIAAGQKHAAEQLEQMKIASFRAGHIDTLEWLSSHA